jgi:hypothetical protein
MSKFLGADRRIQSSWLRSASARDLQKMVRDMCEEENSLEAERRALLKLVHAPDERSKLIELFAFEREVAKRRQLAVAECTSLTT